MLILQQLNSCILCIPLEFTFIQLCTIMCIQVNLDMTDSMGPGNMVRHMQNPSYTYDKYLTCIGLGPSISSVICKNLSYSGPSYPSSPVSDPYASVIWYADIISCHLTSVRKNELHIISCCLQSTLFHVCKINILYSISIQIDVYWLFDFWIIAQSTCLLSACWCTVHIADRSYSHEAQQG